MFCIELLLLGGPNCMQVKIGLLAFPTVGLERLSRSLSWWVSRSSGLHGGLLYLD